MFLAFVAVGLLAIVTALRGNQAQVAAQLEQDFTSKSAGPSFWIGGSCGPPVTTRSFA